MGLYKQTLINGKLLLSAQLRKMGRYIEWNVTRWVEPGKDMRIELWGNTLPLYGNFNPERLRSDIVMDLLSAKIGCVNKR